MDEQKKPEPKLADPHTQRQRVRNLIQSQGRVQPKTNIENDDPPQSKWRD